MQFCRAPGFGGARRLTPGMLFPCKSRCKPVSVCLSVGEEELLLPGAKPGRTTSNHTRLSMRSEITYSVFPGNTRVSPWGRFTLSFSSTPHRVLPLKENTEPPASLAWTMDSFSNPVASYLPLRSDSSERYNDARQRSVPVLLCTPAGSWLPYPSQGVPPLAPPCFSTPASALAGLGRLRPAP